MCGICFLIVFLTSTAWAQAQSDVLAKAMQDEMSRSMAQLRLEAMDKPYFIAYRVDDLENTTIAATLGSLTQSHPERHRTLGVELRVGDYALDNSNYLSLRTFGGNMQRMFSAMAEVPLDDDYRALRRQLWIVTDGEYKKALEDLSAKRATLQSRKRIEQVPDFSKETPAQMQEPAQATKIDVPGAEQMVRELSALFRGMPEIFTSSVTLEIHHTYTHYLNSEGTSFTRPQMLVKLQVKAATQAPDGQPLQDSAEFYAASVAGLPSRDKLVAAIRQIGERLTKLRQASFVDRYNGPVLFEGQAAAEVFANVFAPGLVAIRLPMSDNPQFEMQMERMMSQIGAGSFLEKIGGRILPESADVTDNPLLQQYGGTMLAGGFKIDDDGVPARATKLVEKGTLKTLLAGRTPVDGISHSTGSRRGVAATPSNLVLSSEKTVGAEDLRKELLRRAKLRGRDYGIVVRRVGDGGLSNFLQGAIMGRDDPPGTALLEVYKLFADGHEELVRGAEIAALTSATFRDIVGMGDQAVVYSEQFAPKAGTFFSMGMASMAGGLPVVSYVVPSLLFEEISVRNTSASFPQPPVSKAPLAQEREASRRSLDVREINQRFTLG